jgi:hypothetical protein
MTRKGRDLSVQIWSVSVQEQIYLIARLRNVPIKNVRDNIDSEFVTGITNDRVSILLENSDLNARI